MAKFADLHLHTFYSDGTYSPAELVEKACKADLACIAVADHDTTEAVGPAIIAANKSDIEVIPAIELTSEMDGLEVHILGYCIDYQNPPLIKQLNLFREKRLERMQKMLDKLRQLKINVELADLLQLAGKGTLSRLHLARLLVKEGYAQSISEVFQKFIGDSSPAYVSGFQLTPQGAIRLLKDSGGISVLAHPYTLKRENLISVFVDYGLEGLEVYYPEHSPFQTEHYANLARKYNLLITGGSDCHGEAKSQIKIGSVKIPYDFVEQLKIRKSQNKNE